MMNYLLLVSLQLVIGMAFGFYLSRAESNLTKTEIKLGVAAVMIIAGVILFQSDMPSAELALMNILSIASVIGGVMLGEYLHIRLVKRILRRVDKEMIFESINELTVEVKASVVEPTYTQRAKTETQLMDTLRVLNMAEQNAKAFGQMNLAEKVSKLASICEEFVEVSEALAPYDSVIGVQCSDLSVRLKDLAWETLRKMEVNVQQDLGRNWNTIVYAVRTVTTRD